MNKNTKELLTGIMIGIFLTLVFAIKVMASPIEDADKYIEENQIKIPVEVREACEYYGNKYDIQPEVLEAVCWVESRCQKTAQDPTKSCKGLMQVKPAVHSERMIRLNARNVFGIWDNVEVGTDYLSELLDEEQDLGVALAMYNGQSTAKIEKARKGEYTGYVKQILTISDALEKAGK